MGSKVLQAKTWPSEMGSNSPHLTHQKQGGHLHQPAAGLQREPCVSGIQARSQTCLEQRVKSSWCHKTFAFQGKTQIESRISRTAGISNGSGKRSALSGPRGSGGPCSLVLCWLNLAPVKHQGMQGGGWGLHNRLHHCSIVRDEELLFKHHSEVSLKKLINPACLEHSSIPIQEAKNGK